MNPQLNYTWSGTAAPSYDAPANERESQPRRQRGAADCATRTRSLVRAPSPGEEAIALEVERAIGGAR